MPDTVDIQGKQVQLTHDRQYEFFSDEIPGYPKGLDVNPSNYYIYLSKDKLHPVTEVAAQAKAKSVAAPIQAQSEVIPQEEVEIDGQDA